MSVNTLTIYLVTIATGFHLFPYRTQQLSPYTLKVLGWKRPGRISSRQLTQHLLVLVGAFFILSTVPSQVLFTHKLVRLDSLGVAYQYALYYWLNLPQTFNLLETTWEDKGCHRDGSGDNLTISFLCNYKNIVHMFTSFEYILYKLKYI